jgi:Chaperone of endosialidase
MANKKITQLASKSSILSTDLFPIGDATTGTLYKKTIAELQAAIGGAVVSVNGKVGTVVLNTDDVSEAVSPTNLYFTNTRARGAISLTTTGSSGASTYSSSTGVLNVPTYTLAGLGGITLSSLSGTSPISYNSTTGAISISQATTSTNGYLSSTDWNTFNGKQAALSGGTSGYISFWTGSNTLGSDSGHFWDNTNKRLGIGTSSPSYLLSVSASSGISYIGNIATTGNNAILRQFSGTTQADFGVDATGPYIDQLGGAFRFYKTGGEAIRILNTGFVGIGTSSPGSVLELSQAQYTFLTLTGTNTTQVQMNLGVNQVTQGAYISSVTNHPLIIQTNSTERIRITKDGFVGIGTNNPVYKLQVTEGTWSGGNYSIYANGYSYFNGIRLNGGDADRGIYQLNASSLGFGTSGSYPIIFYTNVTTETMRITGGGNILMGTSTDNGERLYVSGAIRATGTITANSDITLKKNLLKIENALEKVEQINGYTYEFKEDDSKRHAGVIAQEIQGVLPEIVNKGNDGILGVEYGNISALLIEAIKDLKSQNESLQARLVALEK